MKITNKIAMVTGANRGIGLALVEALIAAGAAKIYATIRDSEHSQMLAKLSDKVVPVVLDVTDFAQVEQVADDIDSLDILINNAGIANGSGFSQSHSADIAFKEMQTNYFGPLHLTRALLNKVKHGAIVNVSSIAGISGFSAMGPYSASKAALHSMTQSLRGELPNTQVIGVYPGPVDTRLAAGFDFAKAQPSDVAKAILTAIEQGEEDVYPDAFAQGSYQQFLADPKALEKGFAASIHG